MDIFQHIDYRSPLRIAYEQRKAQGRYSFAEMARDLGIKDRAYIQHILSGNKELPAYALDQTILWLELHEPEEIAFFHKLWTFAQTKDPILKDELWKELRSQSRAQRNEADLACQRTEIFDHWWSFPIKDLLCLGFVEPKTIQKALKVRIPLDEIHRTIARLIQLGFIAQQGDGTFRDLSPAISAPTHEEFSQIIRSYQLELFDLAKWSLTEIAPKDRETQTLGMALSNEAFAEAQNILRETRDRLLQVFEKDQQNQSTHVSNFHQIVLSAFPIAHLDPEQGS
jgi:uncharacterized protein (TIGR02147 family)